MNRIEYRYDNLHNDDNAKFFTYLVIVFNIVYAILGTMMMTMGFYITLDEEFRQYVRDLGMQHYMVGVYFLIAAGILVIVQSFFGVCGAYLKKSRMLLIFFIMLAISFLLEIIGSIYLLINGISGSKLDVWLQVKFYDLIAQYTYDEPSKRAMDIVQEYIGCCGALGIADYIRWNVVVPNSCFNPITGNAWYRDGYGYVGCVYGFSKYVEKNTGWICGIALFLAFFQIFGMISSWCLMSIKKDFHSKSFGDLNKH